MAVIKMLARHNPSYRSLIDYILKEGKNENPQIITHNLRSETPLGWTQEFLQNESYRKNCRSDQIFLSHDIISFSNKDKEKISQKILDDVAHKYIELRGNEGLYFGAVHRDREHTHIHFMTSGTKLYTGKAMRLSHSQLKELKVAFQEYHLQKYPQIEQSVCNHGSNKPYKNQLQVKIKNRNAMKEMIKSKVLECMDKAVSQKDFFEMLREENLYHYERKAGVITGIVHENNKYRFTNLGIDSYRIEALPIDMTEEQKALKEIQEIRKSRTLEQHQTFER